jgi:hypothetical protein
MDDTKSPAWGFFVFYLTPKPRASLPTFVVLPLAKLLGCLTERGLFGLSKKSKYRSLV